MKESYIKVLLIIMFSVICLWLSFAYRSNRNELAHVQALLEQYNLQNNKLAYKLASKQEALDKNFGLTPKAILDPYLFGNSAPGPLAVLYLKAYACSPCHIPVIRRLLNKAWEEQNFSIVAHVSNQDFLLQLLGEEGFAEPGKVTLISGMLYESENFHYDAELLLIDEGRNITALLPLEILRVEGLFAELKEKKFFDLH